MLRLVHTSCRLLHRARPLQVAAKNWKIFYLTTVYHAGCRRFEVWCEPPLSSKIVYLFEGTVQIGQFCMHCDAGLHPGGRIVEPEPQLSPICRSLLPRHQHVVERVHLTGQQSHRCDSQAGQQSLRHAVQVITYRICCKENCFFY